jgi:hypothetical protein
LKVIETTKIRKPESGMARWERNHKLTLDDLVRRNKKHVYGGNMESEADDAEVRETERMI